MDSKKSKSNFSIIPRMIKKRSRSRLTGDPDRPNGSFSSPAPPVPYLNQSASFTSTSFYPLSTSPPPPTTKRGKTKGKQKAVPVPPPLPSKDPREPELTLDTNLEEMDGIVDLTPRLSSSNDAVSSSPGSGLESPLPSSSFSYGDFNPNSTSPTTSMFSNPFPLTPAKNPQQLHRHFHVMLEKVSPKTQAPPFVLTAPTPTDGLISSAASWEAPQSWAVEKDGEDPAEPPDYSSSEESVAGRPTSTGHHAPKKHKSHRTSTRPKPPPKSTKPCIANKPFKVRIYRANNTYHVASIGLSVTVADLTPVLNTKLLLESERETHRLYLKERGRGGYPGMILLTSF